jgi:N-acetylglutamate synthase-like GNAT family acetyltransferase
MSQAEIRDMNAQNIFDYGFCGAKSVEHEGCRRKAEWFKKRLSEGMRYKVLASKDKGMIGLIEYIPGKFAWRAVEADGYMVIHCLCIFYQPFRGKGYASGMIDECLKDAQKEKMLGVAVVTRQGAWMAGKEIFLKKGFEVVDKAPPDFELLAKKFQKASPNPKFKEDYEKILKKYGPGLTIIWSDQCPFIAKAIREIRELIDSKYRIEANIIQLKNHRDAQNAPSPYAVFSLIYDGKLLAFHPISSKRFMNIMDKEFKKKKSQPIQ